jgi:hypothetical protein
MKNKTEQIKKYLQSGKSLTNWECIIKFGYTRLSDIIYKMGSGKFIKTWVNKNDSRFLIYKLKKTVK